jgi:excinuclease UvrABC helicase subunit UvrB
MKINTEIKTLLIGGVLLTLACLVLKENQDSTTNSSIDEKDSDNLIHFENELNNAVENEDYETAARLRDIINSKKTTNV